MCSHSLLWSVVLQSAEYYGILCACMCVVMHVGTVVSSTKAAYGLCCHLKLCPVAMPNKIVITNDFNMGRGEVFIEYGHA